MNLCSKVNNLDISNLTELVYLDARNARINPLAFLKKKKEESENQLKELSDLVLPHVAFDYKALTREIKRLKVQDLLFQIQTKQSQLEKLIKSTKSKLTENLLEWLEVYLDASIQNDNDFVKRQLERSQKLLSKTLSTEKLQVLSEKQKEIKSLEAELEKLQVQSLETQIEIPPKK